MLWTLCSLGHVEWIVAGFLPKYVLFFNCVLTTLTFNVVFFFYPCCWSFFLCLLFILTSVAIVFITPSLIDLSTVPRLSPADNSGKNALGFHGIQQFTHGASFSCKQVVQHDCLQRVRKADTNSSMYSESTEEEEQCRYNSEILHSSPFLWMCLKHCIVWRWNVRGLQIGFWSSGDCI